jgi:hypothetical protein
MLGGWSSAGRFRVRRRARGVHSPRHLLRHPAHPIFSSLRAAPRGGVPGAAVRGTPGRRGGGRAREAVPRGGAPDGVAALLASWRLPR